MRNKAIDTKKKLIIVSAAFPYGTGETFLYNEVLLLSRYFNIELQPLLRRKGDIVSLQLPSNVQYNRPVLPTNKLHRYFKGIFNLSPIGPYFLDFFRIFKSSDSLIHGIKHWFIDLVLFRTFYSSEAYSRIGSSSVEIVYFYWGILPVNLLNLWQRRVLVRVHGREVDFDRNHGYIPVFREKFPILNNVTYLPISIRTAKELGNLGARDYVINRLGVYDFGLNPHPPENSVIRLVSCSNMIRLKRIDLIVDALKMITHQEIEWIHFGDGPLFNEIQTSVHELSNNIQVKFMGRCPNAEVLAYYASNYVDLFVNVSSFEGVPVSIMEAFSFGIPCFATDAGGTGELVSRENGLLVSESQVSTKLKEFILLIRSLGANSPIRSNARATYERFCNAKDNYMALAQIIHG